MTDERPSSHASPLLIRRVSALLLLPLAGLLALRAAITVTERLSPPPAADEAARPS